MALTPQMIQQMNAITGKNVPLDPNAPPSRAEQILKIGQQAEAQKAQEEEASKPKLGQGAAGEFAGNAVRTVGEGLMRTGGAIESGLDETLGRGINVLTGHGNTPTQTGADTQKAVETSTENHADTLAGKAGDVAGTVAPYLMGTGEAAAPEEVAGFIPKAVSFLAKHAPEVLKNTAIGTAQTGDIKQGAETGVGGEIAGSVLPAAGKVVGNTAKQVLGASTGSGASSIQAGFDAAKAGSKAFTDAMRGKLEPDEIVSGIQNAVQNIANTRRSAYIDALGKLKDVKGSLDISPVHDVLDTQLKNFGVRVGEDGQLDFSRSSIANNGSARADIQGVYDTVKDWGTQAGDRTPVGLDTLKKQLGDFYTDSGSARALVQSVKGKVGDILNEVPGYSEMTKEYQKASNLLDDIRSATGAGGKSKADTVFTKLTTALKGDKDFRLEVLREASQAGSVPDLEAKIAGINMNTIIPKGLIGKGIDASAAIGALSHIFNPSLLPALLTTSPRVVGEFINALGIGARYTEPLTKLITAAGAGSAGTAEILKMLPQSSDQETDDEYDY